MVASFVPRSLDSVVRVLHPWRDSQGEPARWAEVADELDVDNLASLNRRYGEVVHGSRVASIAARCLRMRRWSVTKAGMRQRWAQAIHRSRASLPACP